MLAVMHEDDDRSCEDCGGTGVVPTMTRDPDSMQYVPDGEKACICQYDESMVYDNANDR